MRPGARWCIRFDCASQSALKVRRACPSFEALVRKPSHRRAGPQLTCKYGGAVERGASFSWEQDQKFVEKEIDRLFLLGCVTSGEWSTLGAIEPTRDCCGTAEPDGLWDVATI